MSAKEIAERTLELAKDATPGEWQCDPVAGNSLLVATTVLGLGIMASGWGSSDRVREAKANERYIAHASPENMQTLAAAHLAALDDLQKITELLVTSSDLVESSDHYNALRDIRLLLGIGG